MEAEIFASGIEQWEHAAPMRCPWRLARMGLGEAGVLTTTHQGEEKGVGHMLCALMLQAWRRRFSPLAMSSGSALRSCACRGAAAWSAARSGLTACARASTWGPGPRKRTRVCCSWLSSTSAQMCVARPPSSHRHYLRAQVMTLFAQRRIAVESVHSFVRLAMHSSLGVVLQPQ